MNYSVSSTFTVDQLKDKTVLEKIFRGHIHNLVDNMTVEDLNKVFRFYHTPIIESSKRINYETKIAIK